MTHDDDEAVKKSKLPASVICEGYPSATTEGSILTDEDANLNSKCKDFGELRLIDSTTSWKGTTIGAAAGVEHENDVLDIWRAGAKLDPNTQDTAEVLKKLKLLLNDTMTEAPPRCDATVGVTWSIRGRSTYAKVTRL